MAVLQTIRVKFGILISVLIALSLLSFIIDTNTLDSALHSMSKKNDVGRIAGKSISYTDFQEDVEKYTTINQIMTNSSVQDEQAHQQIRNAAWQALLDKYMFVKNAKAAGIKVGEDEILELTTGANISPIIAQNFSDENGFSVEALQNFVQQATSGENPQLLTYWKFLQNSVYTQQFYSKYGALYTNGTVLNKLMEENAVADNNTTADIEYVMLPYGYAVDSTIEVSSADIKKYYKNHKQLFKQNASRDIEYVVFEVTPSEADVIAQSTEFTELYDEFVSTENMKNFLLKNSDRSYSEYWYAAGELATVSKQVSDFVDGAAAGAVSPVIAEGNTFYAAKVLATANVPNSITVRVIPAQGATAIADSLVTALRLAEPMNFTQSYLIPGCEVLFQAPVGKPQFVKTAQYGQLLAEVVERSEPVAKKQVAIFEKTTLPSKTTYNEVYAQANKFASITAGKYEGYKKALDTTKVYSHPMNNITEATSNYGSIEQAKEVTRWAFDAKPGKASEIITVNNNYFFIAALKDVHKEGYASVSEVAPTVKDILYAEKLQEKKAAEVAEQIEGLTSLEAVAEKLGATVSTREGVAFASATGAAVEPALLGAVAAAPQGELRGPVAGQIGVYVFQVVNRETGAFYTAEDAKNYEAQKAQYTSQMIVPVMMQNADVKDNRARFF